MYILRIIMLYLTNEIMRPMFFIFFICLIFDFNLFATSDQDIITPICNIVNLLRGPVGKGVAVVALMFTCFSFFVGKMSFAVICTVLVGMCALFSADTLVNTFTRGIGSDEFVCDIYNNIHLAKNSRK